MFLPLVVAAIAVLAPYLYSRLRYQRLSRYAKYPQMPPSLILGHLKAIDEFIRAGKPNGHPDLAFAAMNDALGSPPIHFVDLRPFGPPMVLVRSHEVAEQITKASKPYPHSPPKMPQVYGHMVHVTGPTSILAAAGDDWKGLRRRFNPGFASQHLIKFLPCILDRSTAFLAHLDRLADTGEAFSLVHLAGNLTLDIISQVVMDADFDAQNMGQPGPVIRAYHELFQTYASEQVDLPWFLTPLTEWKRRRLAGSIKRKLEAIVQGAHADGLAESTKLRSVLSLSLQGIEKLTTQAVDETCDQLSTFLFAGHDTTSILISWAFYELSRTPKSLEAVRNELDEIFGPDTNPTTVCNKLLSDGGQELLSRMTYASAVIKETLRLWPPAGTARRIKQGSPLKIQTSMGEYVLEGVDVYNCATMIQRDPEVYGDTANDFVPERWLQGATADIPASAWRAFERGPRNCIGQELATLEARVVIALVARRYDFVKIGVGELSRDQAGELILDAQGRFEAVSQMYPVGQSLANPRKLDTAY
ncbi:cytochrome P450 [Thozetella sp. PMI_491]|nr:cytochrome P450 [Thozetella sp. PMI_491]